MAFHMERPREPSESKDFRQVIWSKRSYHLEERMLGLTSDALPSVQRGTSISQPDQAWCQMLAINTVRLFTSSTATVIRKEKRRFFPSPKRDVASRRTFMGIHFL